MHSILDSLFPVAIIAFLPQQGTKRTAVDQHNKYASQHYTTAKLETFHPPSKRTGLILANNVDLARRVF